MVHSVSSHIIPQLPLLLPPASVVVFATVFVMSSNTSHINSPLLERSVYRSHLICYTSWQTSYGRMKSSSWPQSSLQSQQHDWQSILGIEKRQRDIVLPMMPLTVQAFSIRDVEA
jgi:hypothetical protein